MNPKEIQPQSAPIVPATPSYQPPFEFIALPTQTPFPRNIFHVRSYDGLKVLALIFLAWATLNFGHTLYLITFHRSHFTEYANEVIDNRGILKKAWYWTKGFFWQDVPKTRQIEKNTQSNINRAVLWGLFLVSVSWLFVWLCFDWQHARHLVFAGISIGFGIAYSLLPVDAIPDFIPAVGALDDVCVNLFGSGLGIAAIAEYIKKRRHQEMISRLVHDNPQAAVALALEEYGVAIKRAKPNA
jgi:uncharacterized membrane protein YkvA (DUF1232 family)